MTQVSTKAPEGYKQATLDMEGIWQPKLGPIHGRLIGAFSFVNSKRRKSIVYLIRAVESCPIQDKDKNLQIAERGDIVGVFHSGSLTPLQNLYGCIVHIAAVLDEDGNFKTKPTPAGDMKLFDTTYKGEKKRLPIEHRTKSEKEKHDAIDYPDSDDDSDDDIPF